MGKEMDAQKDTRQGFFPPLIFLFFFVCDIASAQKTNAICYNDFSQ